MCSLNCEYSCNIEGGKDFVAWKGQEHASTQHGYIQCSQVCTYMARCCSQLRTRVPLYAWKCIHAPPCNNHPAPCECHSFSGSHLRQLRKYPVLCTSDSIILTEGIVSQDFLVCAQCVSLLVISHLQYMFSRGNTCQHLPQSGF